MFVRYSSEKPEAPTGTQEAPLYFMTDAFLVAPSRKATNGVPSARKTIVSRMLSAAEKAGIPTFSQAGLL